MSDSRNRDSPEEKRTQQDASIFKAALMVASVGSFFFSDAVLQLETIRSIFFRHLYPREKLVSSPSCRYTNHFHVPAQLVASLLPAPHGTCRARYSNNAREISFFWCVFVGCFWFSRHVGNDISLHSCWRHFGIGFSINKNLLNDLRHYISISLC